MELRRHKTSMFAHDQDIISNMPDNVVTNILDRLPIQDAVKTSVLSRNWRFKWTMLLSQLLFDDDFYYYLRHKTEYEDNQVKIIIRTLLLQLRGAVTKCVLSVTNDYNVFAKVEDMSHLILFLSRKGIKDLTIMNRNYTPVKLPTHLFSCLELKHLYADHCCFNPPPGFHGFPNLLSLHLGGETRPSSFPNLLHFGGETNQLGEFITRCPLLEILKLFDSVKVNFVDIAKLKNLKVFSFSLCYLDTVSVISVYDIFELLGSLPKLQELDLDFSHYKLTEGGAKRKLSAAFLSLKALSIFGIESGNGIQFSCAFELISSSPNLQALEIAAFPHLHRVCINHTIISYLYNFAFENTSWLILHDADPISIPEVEYKITGLRSVVLTYLKGSESEVCLIKYLLGSSPFLKRMVIQHGVINSFEKQYIFSRKLLKLHRASPVVDIDLDQF